MIILIKKDLTKMKSILVLILLVLIECLKRSVVANVTNPVVATEGHWLNSCQRETCREALQYALDSKCNAHSQCNKMLAESHSECTKCIDDIAKPEALEQITETFFLRNKEMDFQQLGCKYYCMIKLQAEGECERHSVYNKINVCQCQVKGEDASKTANRQTIEDHRSRSDIHIEKLNPEALNGSKKIKKILIIQMT